MILLPPIWLLESAKNNIAKAPQSSSYLNQVQQESLNLKDVPPDTTDLSVSDLKRLALQVTITYGLDFEKFNYTIQHESSYNRYAKSPNGLCYGLGQYLLDTWIKNCSSTDERDNPVKTIQCMGKMWNKGLEYQWDAYCCHYEDAKCREKRNLYPGSILCK